MIIRAEILGSTSLLQHRFGETSEDGIQQQTRQILIKDMLPRERAELACYRDRDGYCYFPGAAIARLLREAGSNHKLRGSRKSLKYLVPAAVLVPEESIHILVNGQPTKEFEVDARPVTIPATKGRIMRYRPRWDAWGARFELEIDETVLPVGQIHQMLEEGGKRIGLGDYRPEKGGPFGRFRVMSWEEQQHHEKRDS